MLEFSCLVNEIFVLIDEKGTGTKGVCTIEVPENIQCILRCEYQKIYSVF